MRPECGQELEFQGPESIEVSRFVRDPRFDVVSFGDDVVGRFRRLGGLEMSVC